MVTIFRASKSVDDLEYRLNFVRLDSGKGDLVFCDGKGKKIPLPYDVQAAIIELHSELTAQRNIAVTRGDECRTLRSANQMLEGKLQAMKEEKASAISNVPVGVWIAITERAKKIFVTPVAPAA